MEPETDAEGGRVPVPPGPEAPKRWPWGRITAVVVVALITITAFAIAVRQPNRPPSITDVSVSDDIAIVRPPTKLLFTANDDRLLFIHVRSAPSDGTVPASPP